MYRRPPPPLPEKDPRIPGEKRVEPHRCSSQHQNGGLRVARLHPGMRLPAAPARTLALTPQDRHLCSRHPGNRRCRQLASREAVQPIAWSAAGAEQPGREGGRPRNFLTAEVRVHNPVRVACVDCARRKEGREGGKEERGRKGKKREGGRERRGRGERRGREERKEGKRKGRREGRKEKRERRKRKRRKKKERTERRKKEKK
ncbi:hypothetical protein P7K49_013485 [Saguinus oedipus]|uniref:Uncharacterized protein n=1 Tax=Saguinus oedipus TaxID=9490 RepID=A0ABQ9VG16_SAGOE|nr:hypothetical protein P7K49_013485 [Saguinus oedipus]